tara:strand:+ start:3063 stop:3446 length:384 start_codon:yes stop_codon:yes gene_type:complete
MKKFTVLLAVLMFGTLSAQSTPKSPDVYLQEIINEYSDCCVKVGYDEFGVLYTFLGGVLVTKVLYMMRDNYLDLYGITGAEDIGSGLGDPYGFVDSKGNEGTFVIFNTPNGFDNIEMTLVLDRAESL